jgi:hypothetical protein
MRTRLVLAVLPVALLGVTVASSSAAPKPIEKSYTASASPDPSPNESGACTDGLPGGEHVEPFKVPAAGKLVVEMTGFQGDWDLCIRDAKGNTLGSSTGFIEATTEIASVKFKKPAEVTIVAQNLMGTLTAEVSYVFTFNK